MDLVGIRQKPRVEDSGDIAPRSVVIAYHQAWFHKHCPCCTFNHSVIILAKREKRVEVRPRHLVDHPGNRIRRASTYRQGDETGSHLQLDNDRPNLYCSKSLRTRAGERRSPSRRTRHSPTREQFHPPLLLIQTHSYRFDPALRRH